MSRSLVILILLACSTALSVAGERSAAEHWSFRPPVRPAVPTGTSPVARQWPRNPIDCFILARLEKEGLTPAPEADRSTLLRRTCFDLLGLPPTPRQVDEFLNDPSPDAYERLIDRLLASPHYGERWGRHWLDAARYADSDGYEKDNARPNAWRYRDWIINTLNRDLPFDRFTIEQLAGDLLSYATIEQRIATGFHRNTLTNTEGGADKEQFRVEATIDRTNTTMQAWMGLTFGCAQCHDHKYDPFSQKDYYRLFAFFNNADEFDLPLGTPPKPDPKTKKAAPGPSAPVMRESTGRRTNVLVRGDFLRPGDVVRPDYPAVFNKPDASFGNATRLDLATWIVSEANPLTARVHVNWTWQKHFGRGLVATPEDFGTQGEKPTHPELLDWLATEFMRRGWSMKALHRLIVTSATYRQQSISDCGLRIADFSANPQSAIRNPKSIDPLNTLLSRQNRLRIEAEVIRDNALAVSGLLVPVVGGPSVRPPQPAGISDLTYAGSAHWVESKGADRYRRGLYTWFQRTSPHPMLTTFDAPDSNVCAVRREKSNTPLQALTLLNDTAFVECARALGRRIADQPGGTDARLKFAWKLCLAREPSAEELPRLRQLLGDLQRLYESKPAEAAKLVGGECAPWVALARVLLNLDEFVTRE